MVVFCDAAELGDGDLGLLLGLLGLVLLVALGLDPGHRAALLQQVPAVVHPVVGREQVNHGERCRNREQDTPSKDEPKSVECAPTDNRVVAARNRKRQLGSGRSEKSTYAGILR